MTDSRGATSSKNWKKRVGGVPCGPMPSGNTCLVKRPGMEKLMQAGIMPDSMMPIIMRHMKEAQSGGRPGADVNPEDINAELMEAILQDPARMKEMFLSFDRIAAMVVVEPKVVLHVRLKTDARTGQVIKDGDKPVWEDIPEDERLSDEVEQFITSGPNLGQPNPYWCSEEDLPVYTDEIDDADKQFIFQFVVGGVNGFESFPGAEGASLAGS